MTDFSRVDVKDFLDALGIRVEAISGHNAIFKCVFHNERRPSARMDLRTTMFICDGCKASGNSISFLARMRGMTNAEARLHIENRYGAGPRSVISELEVEVRRNLGLDGELDEVVRVPPSEAWVYEFMASWGSTGGPEALAYMLSRGFDRSTLDGWQIGFDYISGRVAIPVHDVGGVLVGFKGRAVDPDVHPRYLLIGDTPSRAPRYGFDTFPKSEHVYGLHLYRTVSGHRVAQRIVVVEGELNVVAMSQKSPTHSAVGVAGSHFSEVQRRLIVEHCEEAIVWFDGDSAGAKGTEKVVNALLPYMNVSVVIGSAQDAADLDGDQIDAVIAGAVPAVTLAARGDLSISLVNE